MAITPDDILEPAGLIEAEWFPMEGTTAAVSQALTQRLEEYIEEGERESADVDAAEQDRAVKAWATYRAAQAVWLRLSHSPSSQSHEQAGSASRTTAQIETFKALADEQRAIFDGLLPESPTVVRRVPPTSTTRHIFVW
jgi:hypothetical protein